ncbi:hypothetical protein [Vibrio phage S4-7]|nr:hypothetical protein [Vibrio phage S4-7]
MKTFLTEKHNIPEGATHYYYNTAGFGFYSLIRDTWRFWSPYGSCWKFVLDNKPAFEAFPIPQANIEAPEDKEVEWVNGLPPVGAECEAVFIEHEHKGYGEFLILGYYGDYVWMEYIGELSNKSKHYTAKVDMVKFRKPETEAEKLQRERTENGKAYYELISSIESELMCPERHGYPNMWGELRSEWQEVYIRQAEVLGFSKEGSNENS